MKLNNQILNNLHGWIKEQKEKTRQPENKERKIEVPYEENTSTDKQTIARITMLHITEGRH